MNQTEFFNWINAPLCNSRNSWGAIQKKSNNVILKVWSDEEVRLDGKNLILLLHYKSYIDGLAKVGHRERIEHIERVKRGSSCYLVMCYARLSSDASGRERRRISEFSGSSRSHLFCSGDLFEIDNNIYVERLGRISSNEVKSMSF